MPISGLSPLTCLKLLSIVRWNLFQWYRPRNLDPYSWSFPSLVHSAPTHCTGYSLIGRRFSSNAHAQRLDYPWCRPNFFESWWLHNAWAMQNQSKWQRKSTINVCVNRTNSILHELITRRNQFYANTCVLYLHQSIVHRQRQQWARHWVRAFENSLRHRFPYHQNPSVCLVYRFFRISRRLWLWLHPELQQQHLCNWHVWRL